MSTSEDDLKVSSFSFYAFVVAMIMLFIILSNAFRISRSLGLSLRLKDLDRICRDCASSWLSVV